MHPLVSATLAIVAGAVAGFGDALIVGNYILAADDTDFVGSIVFVTAIVSVGVNTWLMLRKPNLQPQPNG
jgi:ABC-type uncharacterized transport system permease subunit